MSLKHHVCGEKWSKRSKLPDVALDFLFADTAAMQIILNPRQFDVILTDNLFGDILSDDSVMGSGQYQHLPLLEPQMCYLSQYTGLTQKQKVKYSESYRFHFIGNDVIGAFYFMRKLKKVHEAVQKSIEYHVVTMDLGTSFGTNEVGEFVSNYILNKDDLLYFNDVNVHIGQPPISKFSISKFHRTQTINY
jgi:3-isopropylmalate dehydrogenase